MRLAVSAGAGTSGWRLRCNFLLELSCCANTRFSGGIGSFLEAVTVISGYGDDAGFTHASGYHTHAIRPFRRRPATARRDSNPPHRSTAAHPMYLPDGAP